jgi:hypothetical protein
MVQFHRSEHVRIQSILDVSSHHSTPSDHRELIWKMAMYVSLKDTHTGHFRLAAKILMNSLVLEKQNLKF